MCIVCERIGMIKAGTNPYFVKELETGYVVLGDHQHFRGYTLFLYKEHVIELYDTAPDIRAKHMEEMVTVAEAVARAFRPEKMNYECLGNGDAHLHWHLFPRRGGDLEDYGSRGKGPVWCYPPEKMYAEENRPTAEELAGMKAALLRELEREA